LFVQSVKCPVCDHPNNHDFIHCQWCGYIRKYISTQQQNGLGEPIDIASVDARLQQLFDFDKATSYSKKKDSLQKEFKFLVIRL
jgi:hypothetical protein